MIKPLRRVLARLRTKPKLPIKGTAWPRALTATIRSHIALGALAAAVALAVAIWASAFAAAHSEGSAAITPRGTTALAWSETTGPSESPPAAEAPTPVADEPPPAPPDDQQSGEADAPEMLPAIAKEIDGNGTLAPVAPLCLSDPPEPIVVAEPAQMFLTPTRTPPQPPTPGGPTRTPTPSPTPTSAAKTPTMVPPTATNTATLTPTLRARTTQTPTPIAAAKPKRKRVPVQSRYDARDFVAVSRINNANVTFYDCYEDDFCGHMYNGVTVYEGAVACSWNLDIGTKLRIVGDPTDRVYSCDDRGLLSDTWVDVFFFDPDNGWPWQASVGRCASIEIVAKKP
jgi:hypothetical protein